MPTQAAEVLVASPSAAAADLGQDVALDRNDDAKAGDECAYKCPMLVIHGAEVEDQHQEPRQGDNSAKQLDDRSTGWFTARR